MKLLALDTATQICGVGLADDSELVAEMRFNQRHAHNEKLVRAIHILTREVGWQVSDLDCIGVCIGPGSFTGLRIGLSVAKGLAFCHNTRVVAVNTLDVLAHGLASRRGKIAVVLQARYHEVYFATYERDTTLKRTSEYEILTLDVCRRRLGEDMLVVCNPPSFAANLADDKIEFAAYLNNLTQPAVVLNLALERAREENYAVAGELEPAYLKAFTPKKKQYYAE